MAKMLFGHALKLKLKLVPENPFADVKAKNTNPAERRHYVGEADALRLIGAANPTWRVIVALARFGGLRCPSEGLSPRWGDVDFAGNRMTVTSPKTEHLEGRATRVVPIFARLRPRPVRCTSSEGRRATARKPGGWVNTNLRTTFEKLIVRVGLTPWPRLFQSLRASCETDMMKEHPIHVVTAWIGNTPKIALGHYLQTLEADFEKAVRDGPAGGAPAVQKSGAVGSRRGRSGADARVGHTAENQLRAARVISRQ